MQSDELPPVIEYCPSMEAVAEKAQHDPQDPESTFCYVLSILTSLMLFPKELLLKPLFKPSKPILPYNLHHTVGYQYYRIIFSVPWFTTAVTALCCLQSRLSGAARPLVRGCCRALTGELRVLLARPVYMARSSAVIVENWGRVW